MYLLIKYIKSGFQLFGIDFSKFFMSLKGLIPFARDYLEFKDQSRKHSFPFALGKIAPCLSDRFDQAGIATGAYFHQDLLVASKIYKKNPIKHIDIGSRIDGFVAHVACFRQIECFDIRYLCSAVENIKFVQSDMSGELELFNYCDSISSLHAIEHFGLGRYGDNVDVAGYLKCLDNIYRMLIPGGVFYFSVPIGTQRVEFNSQRVFSVKYLIELLSAKYMINTFSYIDDNGNLFTDVSLSEDRVNLNYGCESGCGIFELTKK